MLNDDQIVSNVSAVEESELNQKPITSHSEAETTLTKCIDWFQNTRGETSAMQVLLLRNIRYVADQQKARASKKQMKMTDYFV